jgi:N-acetylmuramoyl-L-alanine amidase
MLLRRIGRVALAVLAAGALTVLLGGSLAVPTPRPTAALLNPGDRAGLAKHHKDPPPPAVQALDPALFSPGACLAFAPTRGDRHETVFLDAGHGGIDPGAVGNTESGATIEESTINLPIELDTMALLRAQGYRVVVSRTQNTTVTRLTAGDTDGNLLTAQGVFNDVAARDVCANLARATVLVGIYMDAGYWGEAGCLTGYDADRPFSADNLRLATLLQDDVLGAMNTRGWAIPDAGVQPDTGLGSAVGSAAENYDHLLLLGPAQAGYFSTPSQMPGALIEPLFLTDPFEGSIAASAQSQQVIAGAIDQAVAGYLSGQS